MVLYAAAGREKEHEKGGEQKERERELKKYADVNRMITASCS